MKNFLFALAIVLSGCATTAKPVDVERAEAKAVRSMERAERKQAEIIQEIDEKIEERKRQIEYMEKMRKVLVHEIIRMDRKAIEHTDKLTRIRRKIQFLTTDNNPPQ